MKRFLLLVFMMSVARISFGQDLSITFAGTGAANQIDSVTATNLATGKIITLPGGATLILTPKTGIPVFMENAANVMIFPNPFTGRTTIMASIQGPQQLKVKVQNLVGQVIAQTEAFLQPGDHQFDLSVTAAGIYLVSLTTDQGTAGYKIICTDASGSGNRIQYLKAESNDHNYHNNHNNPSQISLKSIQSVYSLGYSAGDIIYYQCTGGVYETIMTDSPTASKKYEVVFKACTDPDGKNYPIVKIGNQTWMAANLAYLPAVNHPSTGYNSDPFCYVYGNEQTSVAEAKKNPNYSIYGVLYNWLAVMSGNVSSNSVPSGVQGICPTGWHLPSYAEWSVLTDYLGSNAGGKLKENGTSHWTGPNEDATNGTGFDAHPGGYRNTAGEFLETGNMSSFWSSTEFDKGLAYFQGLTYDSGDPTLDGSPSEYGFSVRCLKNDSDVIVVPAVTTSGMTRVTTESATAGGCVTNDGNAGNTARGICWSTNVNPTVNGPKTIDGMGSGAFISNLTGLAPNTTYYFRSYATNPAGTAYGEQKSLKTPVTGGYGTFTDIRNGRKYPYTIIGSQSWMAENLDYLPAVSPVSVGSASEKKYYVYGYEGSLVSQAKEHINYKSYGALYNWEAAMTACPPGWNVPTDEEWKILEKNRGMTSTEADLMDYRVSGTVGGQLKETGTSHWNSPNTDASDNCGFSATAAGCRKPSGFEHLRESANLWTSSESLGSNVLTRILEYNNGGVWRFEADKSYYGMSVRCIKGGAIVNTAPKASFTISPENGTTETLFEFDASGSSDKQTAVDDLEVRWDFDGDGSWDTDFDVAKTMVLKYPDPGNYSVILEVRDESGLVDSETKTVPVIFAPEGTFVDRRDGNKYPYKTLGTQIWMTKNLAYLPTVVSPMLPLDGNDVTSKYYYVNGYDGNVVAAAKATDNYITYGVLYNWEAARSSCPAGWHTPSDEEWKTLEKFLGMSQVSADSMVPTGGRRSGAVGGKLKEAGSAHWRSPNVGATNSSGFTALPGGFRWTNGTFIPTVPGWTGYYWTSTRSALPIKAGFLRGMYDWGEGIGRYEDTMLYGVSVRCVKDL